MAATCPRCGETVETGASYCPSCGAASASGDPAEHDERPRSTAHGTLLGVPSPRPPAPSSQPAETAAGEKDAQPQPRPKPTKRTMLGMPTVAQPPPPKPSSEPAPQPPQRHGEGGTKLGMPAAEPPPRPQQASEDRAAGPPAAREAVKGRTMLGVPAAAPPPDPESPHPSPAVPEDAPARPGSFPAVGDAEWEPRARRMAQIDAELPSRGSSGNAAGWIAGTLIVLLIAGGVAAYALWDEGPRVQAEVVREQGHEWLRLEVPGAQTGTKVRFGGQEKPLEAGRAKFELASDSLSVGDNLVSYDVVAADGEVHSGSLTLDVPYRIRTDLSALNGPEPAVDVVVTARPGTRVTLDGQPLQLDAQGRAVQSIPLEPSAASRGSIERTVRYRIEPPTGEPVVDELRIRLPLTSMQIDRPGLDVVTDQSRVEIAGAVGPSTQVKVEGERVEVQDGRFVHRYPLPEPGDYELQVVARAPGKAPYVQTLKIRRVRDLREAARDFQADADLRYARLAQNPALYRGRKVAFEGRVYNVDVQGGRSVLQLLARDCPEAQRCPLWVEHSAATDATVNTWLRVLGTVAGEQQFRSEAENVVTVPKIEARYLLTIEP